MLLFPTPLLIAQFLFHAVWLSSIVGIVLIDIDRQPVPIKKFLAWMGTLAIIAVALEPRLLPVKAVSPGWTNERVEAVVQSLLGATLGFAMEHRLRRGLLPMLSDKLAPGVDDHEVVRR